jgi:RimJ/RimL family protein N-acetyltransferase
MLLEGPRVTVRRLARADLEQMMGLRPFKDPLYADANWMHRSPQELVRWYTHYSKDPKRLLCAVLDEGGRFIGSITLRHIDGRRSARLGVTLGAEFVGRGYGSEALTLFLDYYFDVLGFAQIVLDVAGYNQRAMHVYQKLGFIIVEQREQSLGWGKKWAFLQAPRYAEARRFFRRDWLGRRWMLCYEMALERERWHARRRGRSTRMPGDHIQEGTNDGD